MGNIFYIMGKSSTGKDTIYKKILEKLSNSQNIKTIIIYTTRGMRAEEQQGVQYHFVTDEKWDELNRAGKIIESRTYERVQDVVKYFTVDDESMDVDKYNYVGIGTLESYEQMCEYYGSDVMKPIYIEVENKERLLRAVNREGQQDKKLQNFKEVCRRFIADEDDFSEEKLDTLQMNNRFNNNSLDQCSEEILDFIQKQMTKDI